MYRDFVQFTNLSLREAEGDVAIPVNLDCAEMPGLTLAIHGPRLRVNVKYIHFGYPAEMCLRYGSQ